MRLLPFRKRSSPEEALNAYVDGALDSSEAAELEALLAGDPALRSELDDLKAVKQLLASLEDVPAPRSFALDPSSVGGAPRSALPVVTRLAFTAAGVGILVAGFATYSMPSGSDSALTAAPSQSGNATSLAAGAGAAAPAGVGERAATEATDQAAPSALGTQLPSAAEDAGLSRSGRPGVETTRPTIPAAEGVAADAGAREKSSGESSSRRQDESDRAPEVAPLSAVVPPGPEKGPWRATQIIGLAAAAIATLAGIAAWRRGRSEVTE